MDGEAFDLVFGDLCLSAGDGTDMVRVRGITGSVGTVCMF